MRISDWSSDVCSADLDIVNPLPRSLSRRKFDEVYNLACAASPPSYQADPAHTLMTSVVGTQHLLALAGRCGADFLFASTSEVYGDPQVPPQRERIGRGSCGKGVCQCVDIAGGA